MIEIQTRRHGLEPFLDSTSRKDAAGSIVDIQIQSGLGHLNLRGNPQDDCFMNAARSALGQTLPTVPDTVTVDDHRIYWLGPDEWLILTELENVETLAAKLQKSFSELHAAVNNVSGGQIALRVSGRHVPEVLARGCTLDFHPRVFTVGMCAQSGLAKASVLIGLTDYRDQQPAFDIVVRRSFSDYLIRWLKHAAREFGSRISAS